MINYYKNIQWQDSVVDLLTAQINTDKVSQAYLFVGPKGCEKQDVAKAFSASIIRNDYPKMDDVEYDKRVFNKIENNTFADVLILQCHGATTYLIEQIRSLVDSSQYRPTLCQHKIFIIEEADRLGGSAANALLKTLEEPPSYTHIILLADSESNVLPTIVSRCQIVKFNMLPYMESVAFVQNRGGCSQDDAELAVGLFGGDTRRAINFCVNQDYQDLYAETRHFLSQINQMSDWQVLIRARDINGKINEICDSFSSAIEEKNAHQKDELDNFAFKDLQKQNKRQVNKLRNELAVFLVQIIKNYYLNIIKLNTKTQQKQTIKLALSVINNAESCEQMLRYNINLGIFCDALFLGIKETSLKWQK